MNANEKAAGVLDTPATAQENVHGDSMQKRFATLRARAAMHGVTLIADSQPRYLASRWGLTRELADLPAVERWLELVSGSRA